MSRRQVVSRTEAWSGTRPRPERERRASVLHGFPSVIIETFGGGGIPAHMEQAVRALIADGTRVFLTTQCIEGGVHLHKYEVGRRAEAMGAVSLGMRTVEDALAAIMCGEL